MEDRRSMFPLFLMGAILMGFIQESSQQIPSHMWQMMKDREVNTAEDFINMFIRKKNSTSSRPPGDMLGSRPSVPMEDMLFDREEGTLNTDGSALIGSMVDVERDRCEIKLVSYKIPVPPYDPNVLFWPACVKLNQCSGCCNNELLECAPLLEQSVEYEVMKARYPYPGADYFEFEGVVPLVLKQHLACECRCRVQPYDCKAGLHMYEEHACRCRCFNEADALTCVAPKIWVNEDCACKCPSYGRECYDDEVYSEDSCSCVRHSNGLNPPNDLTDPAKSGDVYCQQSHTCRLGYTAYMVNGQCGCRPGGHSQLEGSLGGGGGRPTRPPRPSLPDTDMVPGHPMFVTHTTQAPQRYTRPPRRTRRPRRG